MTASNQSLRSGVAACVLDGLTAKQSARAMGIAPRTVQGLYVQLRRQFGAKTMAQLGAKLQESL